MSLYRKYASRYASKCTSYFSEMGEGGGGEGETRYGIRAKMSKKDVPSCTGTCARGIKKKGRNYYARNEILQAMIAAFREENPLSRRGNVSFVYHEITSC